MGKVTIVNAPLLGQDLILGSTPIDVGGNGAWDVSGGNDSEVVNMSAVLTVTNLNGLELHPQSPWSDSFTFADVGLARTKNIIMVGTPGVYAETFLIDTINKVTPGSPATATFTIDIVGATSPIGSPSQQIITFNIP